jgi:nucleolar protein 56
MDIVTRWFGVFAVDVGRVVASRPFPPDRNQIKERWLARERGEITAEEKAIIEEMRASGSPLTSRDARFRAKGILPSSGFLPSISPSNFGIDPTWEREILLEIGHKKLKELKDPSFQAGEAIRAISDMESAMNLLGERLVNWWVDEEPSDLERVDEGANTLARKLIEKANTEGGKSPPIREARRALAGLYVDLKKARDAMEAAVLEEAEERFPNLSLLIGPLLAARLVAKAGGLARLANLPSSTVQVIGAERAFFDHLRTGGLPPKYGLIYMHPAVHGAPSFQKGKVARTLAGKLSIAARRDLAGAPPLMELKESMDRRLKDLEGKKRAGGRKPPRGEVRATRGSGKSQSHRMTY